LGNVLIYKRYISIYKWLEENTKLRIFRSFSNIVLYPPNTPMIPANSIIVTSNDINVTCCRVDDSAFVDDVAVGIDVNRSDSTTTSLTSSSSLSGNSFGQSY